MVTPKEGFPYRMKALVFVESIDRGPERESFAHKALSLEIDNYFGFFFVFSLIMGT